MRTAVLSAVAGSDRVSRSFAFVDLCRFTDFVDSQGDQPAVVEVKLLRSIVREIAPLCGVRVDKWLGDGVMLVSVDIVPLIAAVVAIEERFRSEGRLSLRAGIAGGPVILLEGDDYIGRAVNVASRLCDHAQEGQILAAEDGLVLPDGVEVTERVTVALRGMDHPVTALSIAGTPQATSGLAATILSLVDGLTRSRQGRAERSGPGSAV